MEIELAKQQMVVVTLPMAPCGFKSWKEGTTERHFAAAQEIPLAEIMLKLYIHKIQERNKMGKWVSIFFLLD